MLPNTCMNKAFSLQDLIPTLAGIIYITQGLNLVDVLENPKCLMLLLFHVKQVDILISKNQALHIIIIPCILYYTHYF